MRITRNNLQTHIPVLILSALCWLLLTAAKPMPEVGIATSEAPWLTETQFAADPSLHATLAQTVVLELESAGRGQSPIRKNSTRFLVEKAQNYSFCIPDDEPHLLRIKLQRSGGRTVINGRRGGDCRSVALETGTYELEIYHDGRSVGAEGKKAFLHRPERQRYRVGQNPGGTMQENLVYPNFFVMNAGKGPTGNFFYASSIFEIVEPPLAPMNFDSRVGTLQSINVWSFTSTPAQLAQYTNSRGLSPWMPQAEQTIVNPMGLQILINKQDWSAPAPLTAVANNCRPFSNNPNSNVWCTSGFIINDQGEGKFTLSADLDNGIPYPLVPREFNAAKTTYELYYADPIAQNSDAVQFEFVYKAYVDKTKMPALQKGEFAVYDQCDFKGTAFVFAGDVDFRLFASMTRTETRPPRNIMSVMLGPSTFLEVTKSGQPAFDIGGNVECGSVPQGQFTVFVDALKFIAATNTCINCNLTGLDFSGDDFYGVNFSGAILTDSNLAGTDFSNGNLTDATLQQSMPQPAMLAGAKFDGANLGCTSFMSADITLASFDSVVLTTDQSCYVDLSGATLDFDTFDVADWRYFDLTSSTVNSVPPVLSSAALPLDLSGANLSHVTWLKGKQLDSVNFGCYARQDGQGVCPTANGTKACTNLRNTALNSTSLKQACLSDASLEGTLLNASNLDGADLSGAQLIALTNGDAATLAGAFMRGADLSSANLTGVDASYVNFYTGLTGLANARGIQAAGASFANAYLAGADFSGTGANLQGTDWSGAVLVSAKFEQSDLSEDTEARNSTSFAQAFMHGADFNNQQVGTTNGANFSNSYWDLSGARTLNVRLPVQNLSFAGYWRQGTCASNPNQICTASTDCGTGDSCNFVNQSGVCKASYMTDPANAIMCTNDSDCGGDVCLAQPECVAAMYSQSNAATPPTDASNKCPDTNPGGCDGRWEQPQIPISEANPPVKKDAFPVAPGDALQCTSADFTWQLGD